MVDGVGWARGERMSRVISPPVSPHQIDMMSLIPFDLLYLQFGFKSIFRANRLLKVSL